MKDNSLSLSKNYFARKKVALIIRYIVITLIAIYILAPLWILIVNSFKSQSDIVRDPLGLPNKFDFSYISNAVKEIHFFKSISITFYITFLSVGIIILIGSISAWILVRAKSKVSEIIFLLFTAAMLIPFQAIMYPLISSFDKANLKNVLGLIIMYGGFGLPMSIFLYHGFVKSVPMGIEEAATIDGCNIFQLFFKIVMPLLKSITVTVIVLNTMWIWNDYLLPFLVIGNTNSKTR